MLKYRILHKNIESELTALNITNFERIGDDSSIDDSVDVSLNSRLLNQDKVSFKFWVENLFSIQDGTMLTSVFDVVTNNDIEDTNYDISQHKYYRENVIVKSYSKSDNTLSFSINKEIELSPSEIHIQTKFNAIKFVDNDWKLISNIDADWINSQNTLYTDDNGNVNIVKLNTNDAAYGVLPHKVKYWEQDKEELVEKEKYKVFYYENDSWKTINLLDRTLEGCLVDGNSKITFCDFHKYDEPKRNAVELDENTLYYTEETYIIFDFSDTHYFGKVNENGGTDDKGASHTEYGKAIIASVDYPFVYFYMQYHNEESKLEDILKIKTECHINGTSQLWFNIDTFKDKAKVVKKEIENEVDVKENEVELTPEQFEQFMEELFPYGYFLNEDGTIGRQSTESRKLTIRRDGFMYDSGNGSFSINFNKAKNILRIPISQKFETDLHHNDMIKTNLIDDVKQNMINPIKDMEKDMYTPAIQKTTDDLTPYENCYNIVFNLHFRKHRDKSGEKWKCDKECYWNGTSLTNDDKGGYTLSLLGKIKSETPSKDATPTVDYFSYNGGDNGELREYQSDLLSYLGFTNDDIKYQKSKVKKSFLRISFYDSDNVATQNLLQTSTVFIDSGNIFSKFVKNIETEEDNMAIVGTSANSEDPFTKYGENGLRINREPMRGDISIKNIGDDFESLENLRMSSQFVIKDKYSSKSSSEGFYFYNFKGNDGGVLPSELYMRVEFNHAGYGRTVPFMMPYILPFEEQTEHYSGRNNKIKTFSDVCYDWSNPNNTHDEDTVGYGTKRYMTYCHIKLKYRYDKDTQKHIYYLDPDTYGEGATIDNGHGNNIILNLYEGKIQ